MTARTRTVLISGASIAGPALAYWLSRYGFAVTVVERCPGLRPGGYAIDVRGAAIEVARRMGVLDAIREKRTRQRLLRIVHGPRDRHIDVIDPAADEEPPPDANAEIMRNDLCAILHAPAADRVEYLFDDTITSVEQGEDGAKVSFQRTGSRTFDLVVGADGLHSMTRSLVFGPEAPYVTYLGAYISIFTIDNYLGLERATLLRNTPGRVAGIYTARESTKAMGIMMFRSEESLGHDPRDSEQQMRVLESVFAGQRWEVPEILRRMRGADDFYFDSVAQVRMDGWVRGRVALLGDAGYGPSPMSGQGTSLAIVGAYVLAGELKAADGEHRVALPRYEALMRGFVAANQAIAGEGLKVLAPRTVAGLWLRNLTFRAAPLAGTFAGLGTKVGRAANAIALPDYG